MIMIDFARVNAHGVPSWAIADDPGQQCNEATGHKEQIAPSREN